MFYAASFIGYILQQGNLKVKQGVLFVPYYFCMMNYAVLHGLVRFLLERQRGVGKKNVLMQPGTRGFGQARADKAA